jgi:serine protease Do
MTTTSTTPTKSILKRGIMIAGAATLGIGLAAGLADGALKLDHNAFAQPIQLSGVQSQLPSFADMVDKVKPAVVSVRVKTQTVAANDEDGQPNLDDLPPQLRRFFEQAPRQQRPQQPRIQQAQGSGFFVSQDGYVVTNNHVVQNAVEVQLVTDGGKTLAAKVIGTDPRTDLALLKVTDGGTFPSSSSLRASPASATGCWRSAIPSASAARSRPASSRRKGRDIGSGPYDDFLQIDAAVNRGNSGGPTFNQQGEVVGVNTAIFSPSGGNVGIAFAVPAATVEQVVAALKKDGSVARGFIGVQIQPVTTEVADAIGLKDAHGALVAAADASGPAAKAGVKRGDTIIAVNGERVTDARDLSRKIAKFAPGAKTSLTIWRDGKERELSFEVGRQPA